MLPCLPSLDSDPSGRTQALAASQSDLVYVWDRPLGVAMAQSLPKRLHYSAGVVAQVAAATVALKANSAVHRLKHGAIESTEPSSAQSATELYCTISLPPIAHELNSAGDGDGDRAKAGQSVIADRLFAWQRLAGCNPHVIAQVKEQSLPGGFALSAELYASVIEGDSLAKALTEGRLFVADYSMLATCTAGTGRTVTAPTALFVRPVDKTELCPVAIRLDVSDDTVVTPLDKTRWLAARMSVQIADANVQESFFHLGRGHFLAEAFALATERQLSSRHPLYLLLSPHFDGTLPINQAARDQLIVAGGQLEELMNPSLDSSLALVHNALTSFSYDTHELRSDLRRRGLDSKDVLPEFAYRDDAVLVCEAIERWVQTYVSIAYSDELQVTQDTELRGWLEELRSPNGGRLAGLPESIATRTELARLLALIVFTTSVFHASVNYTQADFMGWTPNQPTGMYGSPQGPFASDDEAFQALLPPLAISEKQLAFMWQQSQVRDNVLGQYPREHFQDSRVLPALERFQYDLLVAQHTIESRQARRPLPYPYLSPATLTASIHI